ncbi:MAG: hypothetical protein K0S07_904 [Chlamydiales bacterium]|jgi:hypothetical protein|nr:hypothetical protein [Chlamydiales bacterium]
MHRFLKICITWSICAVFCSFEGSLSPSAKTLHSSFDEQCLEIDSSRQDLVCIASVQSASSLKASDSEDLSDLIFVAELSLPVHPLPIQPAKGPSTREERYSEKIPIEKKAPGFLSSPKGSILVASSAIGGLTGLLAGKGSKAGSESWSEGSTPYSLSFSFHNTSIIGSHSSNFKGLIVSPGHQTSEMTASLNAADSETISFSNADYGVYTIIFQLTNTDVNSPTGYCTVIHSNNGLISSYPVSFPSAITGQQCSFDFVHHPNTH